MSDEEHGILTVLVLVGIWIAALIEPTPIGEGVAVTITLAALGLDDDGGGA